MKKGDKIFLIIAFVLVNLVAVWFVAQMFSVAAAVLAGTLVAVFAIMDISVRVRNKKYEDSKVLKTKQGQEERQRIKEEQRMQANKKKEEAIKKQRLREHNAYRGKGKN